MNWLTTGIFFVRLLLAWWFKRQLFLVKPCDVEVWLRFYCEISGTYTIAVDGSVSVVGSVKLVDKPLVPLWHIPIVFKSVSVDFECIALSKLKSLNNAPAYVGQDFNCGSCNQLKHLYGSPRYVGRNFDASCDNLLSFEGGPLVVGAVFTYFTGFPRHCRITQLDALPIICNFLLGTGLPEPTPYVAARMLLHKTKVALDYPWAASVNWYCETDDFLTAVAMFDDYFHVPFPLCVPTSGTEQALPAL